MAVDLRRLPDTDAAVFEVTVPAAGTRHAVTVDAPTLAALGWAEPSAAQVERLVEASFDYLLAREPAGSIMSRFGLSIIETYFPGYFAEMRARLR